VRTGWATLQRRPASPDEFRVASDHASVDDAGMPYGAARMLPEVGGLCGDAWEGRINAPGSDWEPPGAVPEDCAAKICPRLHEVMDVDP